MPTTLRLAWRLQRWELGLLVTSGVALTAVALVLPSLGEAGIGDQRMVVLFLALAGPVLFGSALGIGVVAGEVEHGTAGISWALARSRLRWLWLRIWPIALIGVVVAIPLGAATARLMDLTSPSDIFMPQMRGPIVALHFLVALAVAVAMGAVIRRVLPGLLVSITLTTALLVGTTLALQPWLRDQAVLVPFAERSSEPVLALIEHAHALPATDGGWTLTEPQCASQAECMEAYEALTPVMRIVPGEAYWTLLAIEGAIAAAVVALSMVATVGIIRRWGPR
jgi:hypothetical protein